jgi:hypothetical protein
MDKCKIDMVGAARHGVRVFSILLIVGLVISLLGFYYYVLRYVSIQPGLAVIAICVTVFIVLVIKRCMLAVRLENVGIRTVHSTYFVIAVLWFIRLIWIQLWDFEETIEVRYSYVVPGLVFLGIGLLIRTASRVWVAASSQPAMSKNSVRGE